MNQHEPWCQMKTMGHSDAAQRLYDTYNLHRMAIGDNAIGKWFAVAMADGRSDNVLYDTKRECVRHQHHNEQYYAFVKIVPPSMRLCEAEVMLTTARKLFDGGLRMVDPDDKHGGKDVIKRLSVEDQLAQMRGHNTNLQMPWEA
jgi:hypothetical protein